MAATDQIPEALLEPMIRQLWTAEHHLQAREEGWEITEIVRDPPPAKTFFSKYKISPVNRTEHVHSMSGVEYSKIQRDLFFDVTARALEGSDLHLRALAVVGAMAIYNQHEGNSA